MHTPIKISLVAGLSIAGVGAAAAQADPCMWRWYVASALRAQQGGTPQSLTRSKSKTEPVPLTPGTTSEPAAPASAGIAAVVPASAPAVASASTPASSVVAAGSSASATLACVPTWLTDFRGDLPRIDVPLLVVQGTEDRILPIDVTGRRLPALVKDAKLVEVPEGPHNIGWTHPEEVNRAFSQFLAA